MKYVIDEDVLKRWGISLPAFCALLLIKFDQRLDAVEQLTKHLGVTKCLHSFVISQDAQDLLVKILLEAEKEIPTENQVEPLAKALMELFPQGKKPGTSTYWRGNLKDNKMRLLKFFKLYGTKYSDEQIIEATKRYVDSFNGNYNYMRVLKYFIWKDARKLDAEGKTYVEEVSDLASVLENQDIDNNTLWLQTLK